MDDLLTLFQHGDLILAHGNCRRAERGDIRRLADGIAEETYRDAGLEITHLDLRLNGGIPLNTGYRDKIHIIKGQFCQFRHHGLDEQRGFLRIKTAGQVVESHLHDVLAHLLRMLGVVGKSLSVRDHNIDLIVETGILKPYTFLQRSYIMSHMKPAGGAVSCQNNLFHFLYSFIYRNL